MVDEEPGERQDVLGTLAQGGHQKLDHVQAIVQILAERALFHRFAEVLVGGGDNAQIHANVAQAAEAPERLLLQHAQQLGLERQRNLADLVQEQSALVGQFEQPALLRPGVGERALLVAEQLALQQGFGNRRAVDGQERLGLAQCMVAAIRSLPVPFSPSIRMDVASLMATRRTNTSISRMACDSAITWRLDGSASSVMSLMVAATPSSSPSPLVS